MNIYESEETEVKNIEWLIDDIANERERFANPYDDKEIGEMAQHVYDGRYQGLTYALNKIDELDEPEVLTQEWIDEHTYHEDEYDFYYADPDELKNLLVPKQEEVNQAYKDGYETGKKHAFEKVRWKDKESETVADVISDFWKSFERLKEVLGTEVEEMEE